jgi:ferredoxin
MANQMWEYKIESIEITNLEKVLETRGNEGWELIHYHNFANCTTCHVIFKREKEDQDVENY